MTISMTDDQWAELRAMIQKLDAAWDMTADGRDVGDWTIEERYDRLHQATVTGISLRMLLNEIEAEATR